MIHFVGAGPGAKDLITVRGKELLEKAEIIIYTGSLINPELLEYADEECVRYNSAEMTLDEVWQIMRNNREKNIVRLHTGDPSLYGAIKEQMALLDEDDIPYEVCPGVSSLCGAAAALKTEYTLPGISQSVIITRLEGKTPVPEKENIRSFAVHGTTMVIFLSTGMLQKLEWELLAGGYSTDTPAAIVYKATWPEEKVLNCTVSTLYRTAQEHGITKTALVIVGDFLNGKFDKSCLYDKHFSTEFRKGEN